MHIQFIKRNAKLAHVCVFFPTKYPLDLDTTHEVEHRLLQSEEFFNLWGASWLQNSTFTHGSPFFGGVRLDFNIPPQQLEPLLEACKTLTTQPLPAWPIGEQKRFEYEKSENEGHLGRCIFAEFCKQWHKVNKVPIKKIPAEQAWQEAFDFSQIRVLIAAETLPSSITCRVWQAQPPIGSSKPPKASEKKLDWGDEDMACSYILIFGAANTTKDYVYSTILQTFLANEIDQNYSLKGKAYSAVRPIWPEAGFHMFEVYIDTTDQSPKKLRFSKKRLKAEFAALVECVCIDLLWELDHMEYKTYPLMGIMPEKILKELENVSYEDFLEFYDQKMTEVSRFWY